MTPFQALYGREPPTIARYIMGSTASELNLNRAQTRMKTLADKSRTKVAFEIGDWVYVKLNPYRQVTLRLQKDHKLGRRYFCTFQVLKKIGSVAYKLTLPEAAKIHPVFHVSMLKRCVGTPEQQVTPLQLIDLQTQLLSSIRTLRTRLLCREGVLL
ncbi:uncharacterized protein LOC107021962 [Solanum pennellii]|uniref:Uncharacterized protein LOC107021962 n=1 Tax=Solanum pennellii TaxID=28526 RepID=A0ABM1GZH0_SOLPN|nr:uncharacterized protein LOC107021962 [Solanum pennellii]